MAFVSSFAPSVTTQSSFAGNVVAQTPTQHVGFATVTMEAYSLDKYSKMSETPAAGEPTSSMGPSAYWKAYTDTLKDKFSPFRGQKASPVTYGKSTSAILASSTPFFRILASDGADKFGAGGDPETQIGFADSQAADRYMAKCMTMQYKQAACSTGVYSTACTEGATRGAADDSRVAALAAEFRMKQRSTANKYGDFCESRRKAMILAHGCSYEESLVAKNVVSARTFVLGVNEKQSTCIRYAVGQSSAEEHMVRSVDMQYKALSFGASTGVYGVQCCEGTTSGMAESKRVRTLSTRFRSQQLPANVLEQSKFDSRLYARTMFRSCSYEQAITENFPAVAASMRPMTARY